jgi:multiple sugar transport system ATP-binding protein
MHRIRFDSVTKTYGRVVALDRVDLDVAPDSLTVVCGPPAAGKSVLLRVLVGLEKPDSGRILFDGVDITARPAAERTIGYVPQSFALFPHISVFDNVAYPLTLQGVPREDVRRRVERAADVLRIRKLLGKRPSQLSGGEKQRAAIARGILKDAHIFILDDPLVGLDFKLRESLMEDLADMRATLGATFLYATSDPLEALTMAEHMIVMDAGRVVDSNRVDVVYQDPRHLRAAELVGFPRCNLLHGRLEGITCVTALARFPVALEHAGATSGEVTVVARAEHIGHAGDATAPDAGSPSAGSPSASSPDARLLTGQGEIRLLENLGAESVVHFAVGDDTLVTTVPTPAVADLDLGAPFPFFLRPQGMLLFDRLSGARIGRGHA